MVDVAPVEEASADDVVELIAEVAVADVGGVDGRAYLQGQLEQGEDGGELQGLLEREFYQTGSRVGVDSVRLFKSGPAATKFIPRTRRIVWVVRSDSLVTAELNDTLSGLVSCWWLFGRSLSESDERLADGSGEVES